MLEGCYLLRMVRYIIKFTVGTAQIKNYIKRLQTR